MKEYFGTSAKSALKPFYKNEFLKTRIDLHPTLNYKVANPFQKIIWIYSPVYLHTSKSCIFSLGNQFPNPLNTTLKKKEKNSRNAMDQDLRERMSRLNLIFDLLLQFILYHHYVYTLTNTVHLLQDWHQMTLQQKFLNKIKYSLYHAAEVPLLLCFTDRQWLNTIIAVEGNTARL